MILVDITAATICFLGSCYPVLVGEDTPIGTFDMHERYTLLEGYGGNVIQFKEDKEKIYAIHRIWNLKPSERRYQRIESPDPHERKITSGCINVQPEVFEKLLECCIDHQLKISF